MTQIAVVFQSAGGHTRVLAEAVKSGLLQVHGVSAGIHEIAGKDVHSGRFKDDALMQTLDASGGIVFGCATYMGSGSAIFKSFLETAFDPHWLEQRWKDKIAAGFTNSASQNGDKLITLLQLSVFAMQMSMIWIGVGDLPGNNWSGGAASDLNRLGTWVGAMGQSNADEPSPSRGDIDTAEGVLGPLAGGKSLRLSPDRCSSVLAPVIAQPSALFIYHGSDLGNNRCLHWRTTSRAELLIPGHALQLCSCDAPTGFTLLQELVVASTLNFVGSQ